VSTLILERHGSGVTTLADAACSPSLASCQQLAQNAGGSAAPTLAPRAG
jgi:hypothetical protein